jgi:TnpA family transposase
MPRRSLLSPVEKQQIISISDHDIDIIKYYTLSESDLLIINYRRLSYNKLGFAVLLCYMRYPGIILPVDQSPDQQLLEYVARQLNINTDEWQLYGQRLQTRREHLVEIQNTN